MNNQDQIEVLFRKLHNESVSRYEDDRRKAAEDAQRVFHNLSERAADIKLMIPELTVDQSALTKATEREKTSLNKRLEVVGHQFSTRQRVDAHSGLRRSILASNPAQISAPIFAVGLMADDHSQFEKLAGERGNPWILPSNPAQVNIKVRQIGMGDYFFFAPGGPTLTPVTTYVDLWFLFWPDKSALWRLTAVVDLFGYYYLRSNDSWYDDKWTKAQVIARAGAYQYFWSGVKSFTLLDRNESNIDEGRLFDDGGWFDTEAFLRVGDPVFFLVQIQLVGHTHGNGCYSEVNFSDGEANYIQPLILLANPL
jgi:hypothetical protein